MADGNTTYMSYLFKKQRTENKALVKIIDLTPKPLTKTLQKDEGQTMDADSDHDCCD